MTLKIVDNYTDHKDNQSSMTTTVGLYVCLDIISISLHVQGDPGFTGTPGMPGEPGELVTNANQGVYLESQS